MGDSLPLPDTLNATWRNNKSRFGYKMLQKMGWSEDKGLGKNESGAVDAIKLKKRDDGVGLGVEKMTDGAGARGWSQTANGFNSVLESLKATYGSSSGKKAKKKKARDEDDTEVAPQRIQVGVKYKKHSLAKALSNKTDAELRSVLGVSHSPKTVADSIYKGSGGKKGREGDAAPAVDGHKKEKKKKRRVDEEI